MRLCLPAGVALLIRHSAGTGEPCHDGSWWSLIWRCSSEDLVRRLALVAALVLVATACTVQASRPVASPSASTSAVGPPGLHVVARIRLPGGNSRFDYASLDPGRGLLFVAHLGASQVVEINIRTHQVVRTIPGLPQVHGVLVVPALHLSLIHI